MADDVVLDAGSGGDTIAADDDGSRKHQYVKVEFGPNDTQTKVTITEGLPIQNDDTDLKVTLDSEAVVLGAGTAEIGKLAAGTAGIGKLTANSGVDIGDVDVLSIIPGTGATNLGKAIDSAVGATDTGMLVLGVHDAEATKIAVAEEDYDHLHIGELGGLSVEPEQHNHLNEFDADTGWTVLGNDTVNLVTSDDHLTGSKSLKFDKTNGAANTIFAGIQNTITAVDMGELDLHDIVQVACFMTSIDNVAYVFVRIGTDASNYNEWRVEDTELTANEWTVLGIGIGNANFTGGTGTGVDWGAITYIAVGVAFDLETNALTNIRFDQLGIFTSHHSAANLTAEVSSAVNTAKIDLQKINGSVTDKGAGNVSNGSQRVVLASDQNFVKLEDVASADLDAGIPAMARRTATPADTSGTDLDYEMLQMDNGRLWTSTTIDAALPAGTNGIGKLTANSGVDIGDVDILSLPASTNTLEVVGDVAHDAAAAGNPVLVAGIAQDADDTAPPNRVTAEADATQLATDFDGALFVRTHGPQVWSFHEDSSDTKTDTEIHAAPGADLSLYVTDIIFSTGAATALNIFFEESTTKVLGPYYLEAIAGRGLVVRFATPKKITANTALTFTTSTNIAHSIDVTGYIGQG